MYCQPIKDSPFDQPLENVVTFNLIPDLLTIKFKESFENKEVNQLPLNACSKYTSPEAARRGFRKPPEKSGGRAGGRGRGGPRKRHPNFAARNRKIGKGGPTGRGAFSGQRRRRPTGPAPPSDSDGEMKGYEQDVDMKTGRIKRRQRPKSDEAKEKARRRKEEDINRKANKKKRPGPKQKDREEMKEKVKRFWRETPQPKHKKAPKLIMDGFESEREKENEKPKRKKAPEDFDDLRMPSRAKLKKQKKEAKKHALRKQRKRERKKFAKGEEKSEIDEGKEPTLSEMEGIQADFGEFLDEESMDPNNDSTELDSQNLFDDKENHDTIKTRTFSDVKADFESLMKKQEEARYGTQRAKEGQRKYGIKKEGKEGLDQLNHTTEQDSNLLNIQHQFDESLKRIERGDLSDVEDNISSFSKKVKHKKSSTNLNTLSEGIFKGKSLSDVEKEFDLFMEREKKSNGLQPSSEEEIETREEIEVDQELGNQSDYEIEQGANLFDSEFDENINDFKEQNPVEDDLNSLENQESSIGYSNEHIEEADSLPNEDQGYIDESKEREKAETKSIQKDYLSDEFEYDEDFEKDYEGIKKYLERDSETTDSDSAGSKLHEKDGDDEQEYTSASDDDLVWNREEGKFVKPRKKKKKKTAHINFEGTLSEGKKAKKVSFSNNNNSVLSNFNKLDTSDKEAFFKSLEEEPLSDDEDDKADMKDVSASKENRVKSVDKKGEVLHIKPTGSVVDEKLSSVRKMLKEFDIKNNSDFEKHELIDEIGQMLYNEDDGMFKLEGDSDIDKAEDGCLVEGNDEGINMKDYENYVSENVNNVPADKSTNGTEQPDLKLGVERGKKEIENIEDSTDSTKEESSESYREEFDVALMAGFRSDRIRVYDQNVSLYADQDHQAKKFETKTQTKKHRTLSDFETENAKRNGKLLECKNDEVIASTESEEHEEKNYKSRRKKSHGKKIISPNINENEINEKLDKSVKDCEIIDEIVFVPKENEVAPQNITEIQSVQTTKPAEIEDSEIFEPRERSAKEETNTDVKISEQINLNLEISNILHPGISIKEKEELMEVPESKITMGQEIESPINDNKDKLASTKEKSAPKTVTENFNLLEGLDDDEEEEEEPKDNSALKEEWTRFATNVNECFGHDVQFPLELPDECPSEEEEPVVPSLYDQYHTRGFGNDVYMKDTDDSEKDDSSPPDTPEVEEIKDTEQAKEESKNMAVITDQNSQEEPFKLKKGINEYLEEDQWDLWYKFIALMNDDKRRSYDNCAALFKAKKQEIMTRTKAPIPPWEEPGLTEYERDHRRVQREWDKTERYYALESQKDFNKFVKENDDEEKDEKEVEGYDPELEDTYRTIFDLLNTKTEDYDHQAYKDSLSREELAEIYSEEEVEEELRGRELRKREKENEANKAPAAKAEDYPNIPDVDDPLETFRYLTSNLEIDSGIPDYIKNKQTDLQNFKTYSEKMEEMGNTGSRGGEDNEAISDVSFNIKPKSSSENLETEIDDKIQVNKGEQAKKMWQYFQQLMKERHEKNIEKFLTTYSPTKKGTEEGARRVWQEYAAFATGNPINTEISADTSRREEANQSYKLKENTNRDLGDVLYEKPQEHYRGKFSKEPEPPNNEPSPGWKSLMQRIDAMKLGSDATNASAPPPGTEQPVRSDYSMAPQYRGEAPSPWGPPSEPYRPPPSYEAPGAYSTPQVPYGNAYDQAYEDPRRMPFRGAPVDPYNAAPPPPPPPATNYSYGFPPPQRGVQGVTQSQFYNHRGDYYDPYGKPLPPNVSLNRAYKTPEMGYQNPDFTRTMDERAAYMANQADPYTANRSRVGWPGDHSDKFHNRRYFTSDLGGQQTYIPRDFSGQPGDHSDRYLNRSNFRNPNFGYRSDTYSNPPFGKTQPDYNPRSIKWWQSGTRPLASSGLQAAPPVDDSPQPTQDAFEPPRRDSMWPEPASQLQDSGPSPGDVEQRE